MMGRLFYPFFMSEEKIMRTIQERIHQFLMNYNYDEIVEHLAEERLMFISGALYGSSIPRDEYKPIARFSLNEHSVFDIRHKQALLHDDYFNKPLSQINNDESKFFHVCWGNDQRSLIKREYDGVGKREAEHLFSPSYEIFDIIAAKNESERGEFSVRRIFEEINGEVTHGYKLTVSFGRFGQFYFCTKSNELSTDDTFHHWLIAFASQYCEHLICKEDLEKDFFGELKKIPQIPEYNTEKERSKRDMEEYFKEAKARKIAEGN